MDLGTLRELRPRIRDAPSHSRDGRSLRRRPRSEQSIEPFDLVAVHLLDEVRRLAKRSRAR